MHARGAETPQSISHIQLNEIQKAKKKKRKGEGDRGGGLHDLVKST